jgi:hypothetical protein
MDSFEKAAKERERKLNMLDETNPTNKLYSASQGGMGDFSSRDPLANLPASNQAGLDAAYAETDKYLNAAERASARAADVARRNDGRSVEGGTFYTDKYNVGTMTDQGTEYTGMFNNDQAGYAKYEALEKQGLITISPQLRAEMEKTRKAAGADMRATQEARAAMRSAAETSPRNPPVMRPRSQYDEPGSSAYVDDGRIQERYGPFTLTAKQFRKPE